MKKCFLVFITTGYALSAFGQIYFNITSGTNIRAINGGQIIFNSVNIINNGYIQSSVSARFTGGTNDTIYGTGNTVFDKLHLAKAPASKLTLKTNVIVNSDVLFAGGLLDLDQFGLNLGGILVNESETSRAYTTGDGYIVKAVNLNAPSSVNPGNLGAVISTSDNMGSTLIIRGHKVQLNVNGSNNSIARYYDITPTNNISLKATLRFHYFDAELNGLNESTLSQWKKKNATSWDFVGADSRNSTANFVERKNISKFARWTLGRDISVTAPRPLTKNKSNEPNQIAFDVKVTPNPTSNSFTVLIQSGVENEGLQLQVVDILGRTIELKSAIKSGDAFTIGEHYMRGVYFIVAIQGSSRKIIRVIKQ